MFHDKCKCSEIQGPVLKDRKVKVSQIVFSITAVFVVLHFFVFHFACILGLWVQGVFGESKRWEGRVGVEKRQKATERGSKLQREREGEFMCVHTCACMCTCLCESVCECLKVYVCECVCV